MIQLYSLINRGVVKLNTIFIESNSEPNQTCQFRYVVHPADKEDSTLTIIIFWAFIWHSFINFQRLEISHEGCED